MKVFLTGGSGFVGSHVLDQLLAQGIPTRLLLRRTSSKRWIPTDSKLLEWSYGSLDDPISLAQALSPELTHVIHCAGLIQAASPVDFYRANAQGTRNLLEAIRQTGLKLQRFVLISSLSASHPASPDQPAKETDPSAPLSEYGKSKLAGEKEVRNHCPCPYVILRPSAVYGPRDVAFLPLFRLAQKGFYPKRTRPFYLNPIYVKDLARVIVASLDHPETPGQTIHVTGPDVIEVSEMGKQLCSMFGKRPRPIPLPFWFLQLAGWLSTTVSRLSRQPILFAYGKDRELTAPGWVADRTLLQTLFQNHIPFTPLQQGLQETLQWYQKEKWL